MYSLLIGLSITFEILSLYLFIAKLESLFSEEAAIIKQFNSTTDITLLDNEAFKYRKVNEKSQKTLLGYNAYWRTIDPALMKRLKQLYAVDIIMFGYPHDPIAE